MAAMDPIVISVTADIGPLAAGMSKGVSALAVMEKQGKSLQLQLDKIGQSGVAFQKSVSEFAGISAQIGKSAASSADAFKAFDAAKGRIDGLRASMDPLYAASMRYDAALASVNSALSMGIIKQSEANQVINLAETEYQQVARAAALASGAAQTMGKHSGAMAFQVQNAAFQISDFAVQVGMGTSAIRAAGQQLPQLLGGFGMWGAVIGGAVAVLGALIPALMNTGKASGDAKQRLGELDAALQSYTQFAQTATSSTEELKNKFGEFADEIRRNAQFMAQVEVGKAIAALGDDAAGLTSTFAKLTAAQDEAAASARSYEATQALVGKGLAGPEAAFQALEAYKLQAVEVEKVAVSMGLTATQAFQLRDAMTAMDGAKSMVELEAASQKALDTFTGMFKDAQNMPPALIPIVEGLQKIHEQAAIGVLTMEKMPGAFSGATGAAQALLKSIKDAMSAMIGMRDAQPGGDWLSAAISQADVLWKKLVDAGNAARIAAMQTPFTAADANGKVSDRGALNANMGGRGHPSSVNDSLANAGTTSGTGGGGGGGGADPLLGNLTTLQDSLKTATQIEMDSYASRQQTLDAALAARMISQQTYLQSVQAMQQQHTATMADIDVWQYGDSLQQAGAFFGGMATAMQSGNERMQAIGKKFAAVEALVNAWRAFSQVLADPTLPWFAKIPAGLGVLAAGMGAVSALGGSGGGGSKGAATAAASSGGGSSAPAQQPGTYMNFSFQGAYGSTEDFGRFMVASINKAVENGAVIRGARIA